ncbi:MAG: 4Fe-4S dicluster domain-containing protein [Desulfobacterales bacterium]
MMQLGFYFNQTRCTGCSACRVACKDWHNIPAGPANWMRVLYTENGKFPNVFVAYLATPCYHCLDPVCVPACPVNAISKRDENGIVLVDREACLGNLKCDVKCLKACAYDAPQFGTEQGAKMQKCNLCIDRWTENKLPVCVEACPTRALDSGPLDELVSKYGKIRETERFAYSKKIKPAVVFTPKLQKNGPR